jgi:hypothetical protein
MERHMPGNKTHEQQLRQFQRKDDAPKVNEPATHVSNAESADRSPHSSATPPSREESGYATGHGSDVESRDHNKHNNAGQQGHKPQHHSRAEEQEG